MANEDTKKTDEQPARARILSQGKAFPNQAQATPKKGIAGKYRVTHGVLALGYDNGQPVSAFPDAVVELSAADAAVALEAGTVVAL